MFLLVTVLSKTFSYVTLNKHNSVLHSCDRTLHSPLTVSKLTSGNNGDKASFCMRFEVCKTVTVHLVGYNTV